MMTKNQNLLLMAMLSVLPFIPIKSAEASDYCREYTKTVRIGGNIERAYGTACYRPDGSWEIVSLRGSDYGRAKVRETICDDLNIVERPQRKMVVVNKTYKPHYTRSAYYHWPYFGIHVGKPHYGWKKKYRHYKHHKYHHGHGKYHHHR